MQTQFDQLEELGYAVFPGFLDKGTTARIRAHMDALMPAIAPRDVPDEPRVRELRHPIPGAIMAEILANPKLLDLATNLLSATELKLLEQVLIRTEGGPAEAGAGAGEWHIDFAFAPRHHQARPRQTYYHMVHCLNTVPPHGGAFMIVPGSHKKTYAVSAGLNTPEELEKLHHNPIAMAGIDIAEGIEVTPEEGDLLVFNPMALHSGSRNVTDTPRYVYFASFRDASADYLREHIEKTSYNKGFPDSLRDNLPNELLSLLDQ